MSPEPTTSISARVLERSPRRARPLATLAALAGAVLAAAVTASLSHELVDGVRALFAVDSATRIDGIVLLVTPAITALLAVQRRHELRRRSAPARRS